MLSVKNQERSIKSLVHSAKYFFGLLFFGLTTYYLLLTSVSASHCPGTDYDCQISEIQREIEALSGAHEYNKKELSDLKLQTSDLEKRINSISLQLVQKERDIREKEEDLAFVRGVFEEKTKNHYKYVRLYDDIAPFLFSEDALEAFRELFLRKKAEEADIATMDDFAGDLIQFERDKIDLEKNKTNLAALQKQVSDRAKFLQGEVDKTESYLTSLSSKQEELAALKSGGFATSVGETPATLEPCSGPPGSSNFCNPAFRPAFAAFSFGAPHRTGMSQYGAYGRSKSGQSAEAILTAYYPGAELKKDYASPDTIGVSGYGRIAFEDNYLLGIYEVPESWGESGGFEALKAQAVAARSYALAVTGGGGGTICPTESCQVYKPQLKSGKWREAVAATRGWIMTKGGSPATTYYASTSGGYTISQWGWSGIKDAAGEWPASAYEKISASPWFYKGWYKSRGGSSCGRGSPWLSSAEVADILNAWRVLYHGGGDASRVSPIDTSCWGGNPYSHSELLAIGGYDSVSGVSVVYSNSGNTQSLTFQTNKGSLNISGEEFKKAFNLRAPGYIGLKSSLFNIEKL